MHGDPAALHDVFRNLLENAVNYSPEDGHGRDGIAAATATRLLLTVTDAGTRHPGSRPAAHLRALLPGRQGRSRASAIRAGPGLGLAIVKHLVELHDGRVSAANRREGGAIFTVELPAD